MPNLSQKKRQRMLEFLEELKKTHSDDASIRAFNEIENHIREKKFGLVFEEHIEAVDEMLQYNIPVLCEDKERRICKDNKLPWNFIIEGDNLQALYLLQKTHRGKVDCIYIDPPYNTGAKDWKYNNDYVDGNDAYRHSKWLSMMESRLKLAKELLDPKDSVLICTIDEKEYLHLGCLLEEMFPSANIQMLTDVVNPKGVSRGNLFSRAEEYIYFVFIGNAAIALGDDDMFHPTDGQSEHVRWASLQRSGSNSRRFERPNLFYPIFFDSGTGAFVSVGDSLPIDADRNSVAVPDGQVAIFPLGKNSDERTWQLSQETFLSLLDKGYIKFGKWKSKRKRTINYLSSGIIKQIEAGELRVSSYSEDGSVILEGAAKSKPLSVWNKSSHSASDHGSTLLSHILCGKRFTFPKSLYAEHDAIKFAVANKPDALIVDFFAGSGTTFHAVNLLNEADGGNRRCIMVTNNEVSLEEAKALAKQGYRKGDPEWEALGIAKYVTWPRTVCTIEGHDVNGKPLRGYYNVKDVAGEPIPMARGFVCNVKYFKCDWTPRKPEDYLLSNALCLHIKEMIELQNGIEVDNIKNVLILNKEDFRKYVMDDAVYRQIKNLWVNQNIVFNSGEMERLNEIGFKYIPKEFFGQELMEAAE